MTQETIGMMDARCRNCGKRIGWRGRAVDMPACPRCGTGPDRVALEHDQAQMDEFRELLAEMKERKPGWPKWARARVAAGLTHGQAARMLGVSLEVMVAITERRADPLPAFAERMARCYGVDDRREFQDPLAELGHP